MAWLLRCLAGLSPAQRQAMVYGDWSVKDVLAHLPAWDRELARAIDELLASQLPTFVQYATRAGEAAFNARAVEASRAMPFAQALAELREAHEALMGQIEALTDEQWERATAYRWGNRTPMTIASLFDYSYKGQTHYGGHAQEIERWAARRR